LTVEVLCRAACFRSPEPKKPDAEAPGDLSAIDPAAMELAAPFYVAPGGSPRAGEWRL
jgi:hypothetical protein